MSSLQPACARRSLTDGVLSKVAVEQVSVAVEPTIRYRASLLVQSPLPLAQTTHMRRLAKQPVRPVLKAGEKLLPLKWRVPPGRIPPAMKLAISGKGGVGKTTLAALLAREAGSRGYKVWAVDADPDANLAATLGIEEEITPLAELEELIRERTGGAAGMIKLNPKVDDIPDRYSVNYEDGIRLMALGAIRRGGAGCACPENSFLRGLLQHLLLERDELVIVDMEAGIEHLGRGTAQGVDALLVVVDPDKRSLETAARIMRLAQEIGLRRVLAVGNRVRDSADREYIEEGVPSGLPLLGSIGYSEGLRLSGREGLPSLPDGPLRREIELVFTALTQRVSEKQG